MNSAKNINVKAPKMQSIRPPAQNLTEITLRGRKHRLTPWGVRFMNSQTKEHNVWSKDGHEWEIVRGGQGRTCKKCLRIQSWGLDSGDWFDLINSDFTTEDVVELIKINS